MEKWGRDGYLVFVAVIRPTAKCSQVRCNSYFTIDRGLGPKLRKLQLHISHLQLRSVIGSGTAGARGASEILQIFTKVPLQKLLEKESPVPYLLSHPTQGRSSFAIRFLNHPILCPL